MEKTIDYDSLISNNKVPIVLEKKILRLFLQYILAWGAIWQPSSDTIDAMRNQCEKNQYPDFDECLVSKMGNLGASLKAVAVTRYLLHLKYPFCFVSSFKQMGHVDIAEADCPFMANTMGFTFLVSEIPSIVQVGDSKYLSKINLANHPLYSTIRQKFPQVEL
jgi:hypothetical protein